MSEQSAEDILARANEAVASLKEGYKDHLLRDMETLRDAAMRLEERAESSGDCAGALRELFITSHNMKGQAGTFGYTLVTDVSELLCEYLRAAPPANEATRRIVRVHVDALGMLVDHDIEGDGGEMGVEVVDRLRAVCAA